MSEKTAMIETIRTAADYLNSPSVQEIPFAMSPRVLASSLAKIAEMLRDQKQPVIGSDAYMDLHTRCDVSGNILDAWMAVALELTLLDIPTETRERIHQLMDMTSNRLEIARERRQS